MLFGRAFDKKKNQLFILNICFLFVIRVENKKFGGMQSCYIFMWYKLKLAMNNHLQEDK